MNNDDLITATAEHPILLFDGVCNLCHGFVQFLLLRDPKGQFRYASLQSDIAQQLLEHYQFSNEKLDTVVMIENGKIYSHSDVGLRIVRRMNGLWPLLSVFMVIPRFIRDPIYNWIAANRYRWFGKKDQCMMPQPEWKERFLDA